MQALAARIEADDRLRDAGYGDIRAVFDVSAPASGVLAERTAQPNDPLVVDRRIAAALDEPS